MALFPYGIPKTEKKATSNLLGDWDKVKEALTSGLSAQRSNTLNTVLNNQQKYLAEEVTKTGRENLQKIMMPMIRRILPGVIANDIMSVQPMMGPTGSIYSMGISTYEYKNILVKVTKVDTHWNCEMNFDGKRDRVGPIKEWLKENIAVGLYWTHQTHYSFFVNVYSEDEALALSLRWHNAQ